MPTSEWVGGERMASQPGGSWAAGQEFECEMSSLGNRDPKSRNPYCQIDFVFLLLCWSHLHRILRPSGARADVLALEVAPSLKVIPPAVHQSRRTHDEDGSASARRADRFLALGPFPQVFRVLFRAC